MLTELSDPLHYSCILCNNSSQKTVHRNVTYHSFPRDPRRRKMWLRSLKLDSCTDWHRVCSDHFSPSDFRPGEKRLLWSFVRPKLDPSVESYTNAKNVVNTEQLETASHNLNEPDDSVPQTNVMDVDNTTQLETTSQDIIESVNSDNDNVTTNPSLTDSKSIRRSCRKIKPVVLSDDTTFPNTLVQSNQEKEDKKFKCKKKPKDVISNGMHCSAKNCQNKYPVNNLSFFGYPSDPTIRQIWIKNCGSEDLVGFNSPVKSTLKVCGNHFEKEMFNNVRKNRLVANAIPTIFNTSTLDTSQLSSQENSSFEMVEASSNDSSIIESPSINSRIIESSNSLNVEDEQKSNEGSIIIDEDNNSCCIPKCIYNASMLNEKKPKSKPRLTAFFCPAVETINDWSTIFGIPLTTGSKVCERHFKPEDIVAREVFIEGEGVGKLKRLKIGALPRPFKKTGGSLKRSRFINNINDDVPIIKNRKHSNDISKITSSLSENENSEFNNIGPSTSALNLHSESIDLHSNVSSNSMAMNNSQASLNQILPKILANNSLSISIQPNVNIKPDEKLSSSNNNSLHNTLPTSFEQILSKNLTYNNSLSITYGNNINKHGQISASQSTKENKPKCEIKNEPIDDIPQTISTDDFISVKFPSQSNVQQIFNTPTKNTLSINSEQSIEEIEAVDTYVHLKEITYLESANVKHEPLDDLQTTSTNDFSPSCNEQQIILNSLVDCSVPTTLNSSITQVKQVTIQSTDVNNSSLTIKPEPIDDGLITLVNNSQFNYEPPLNSTSNNILLAALQSSNSHSKISADNSISHKQFSKSIQNKKLLTTNKVSNSLSQYNTPVHLDVANKKIPSDEIDVYNMLDREVTPPNQSIGPVNPEIIFKDILNISLSIELPNDSWTNLFNSKETAIIFIEQDEFLEVIKKVYFCKSYVPLISINNKPYEYKRAVKTKIHLENLLEEVNDIELCNGFDGVSHPNCIGYFESTSDAIEVCRYCQNVANRKYKSTMDQDIKTKIESTMNLQTKISEMQIIVENSRKQMLEKKKKALQCNNSLNLL